MKRNSPPLLFRAFGWQKLALALLLFYIGLALYAFFKADSLLFMPPPSSYQDTDEVIKLPITDQENISALYLPNPQATFTLLYIHGNAEDLGDIRPRLERLQQSGLNVFAYDYRGYGTSKGHPSEQNAYADAQHAYVYLTQTLGVKPDRLLVQGRSLGGGSAVFLAQQYPVAGLILESTFTSAFRVLAPIPLFPFDKFTNLDRLKDVKAPVLVMHGEQDQVIPFDHGQRLFEAASDPKLSLWVAGAGHNNFPQVAGKEYFQTLKAFQALILD